MWVPVVLISAIALTTTLVLALRSSDLDPSTPEGHVQQYARAVVAEDYETALSYLDPGLGCTVQDLRWAWVPSSLSVTHEATRVTGDRAHVDLRVTEQAGPLSSGWQRRETIVLDRTADGWVISRVPWPLYHCEMEADS